MITTFEEIKKKLKLQPLPEEGGFYSETYRSSELIPKSCLPKRFNSSRAFATAIYYALTPDTYSAIHRLPTDEVYNFYLGDPVEMLQLNPDGMGTQFILGDDIMAGMHPQLVVPKGVWQGSRLVPGGKFALLGTVVAPGFEFADYHAGRKEELVVRFPQFRDLIQLLTR